jgi:hypothetical protein
VTIKRDATLPAATITAPANGATYAFGQTVLASYSCTDTTSGTATCTGPVASGSAIDTRSGGPKTFRVTATDKAGNVKATAVSYTVADATPPVIAPAVSGTLGNNGWYTSNVSVTWSVSDAESTIGTQSGCGPTSITVDTSASGTTLTCAATSAGGTSSKSVTIKRDATLPTATITTPAFGATYTVNQPVTASFACSDAGAGIATCTGTVANGVAINTSSTGAKTFTVTAVDQAGNLTTRGVTYSVTGSTPSSAGGTRLFAWNDLGMHCMDTDYSVFTLLPPFNTLTAQLMVNGKLVNDDATSANYTIEYVAMTDPSGSTNSSHMYTNPVDNKQYAKTNFWDTFTAMFGAPAPNPGVGIFPFPTPTAIPAALDWNGVNPDLAGHNNYKWYEAYGIPVTPTDDQGRFKPYPMVQVTAKNSSGQVIATTSSVLPVSTEMNCKVCHASVTGSAAAKPSGGWVNPVATNTERDWRVNVLRLHDERNKDNGNYAALLVKKGYGASLEGSVTTASPPKPIFCDTCHNSNALAYWGFAGEQGVTQMTEAMHKRHAKDTVMDATTGKPLDQIGTRDACYACHPGKSTNCLRGAMGNPIDPSDSSKHLMECQSCHGSMKVVGSAQMADPSTGSLRARSPWFDMPTCQTCHQNGQRYTTALTVNATNNTFAYRSSTDPRFATNTDKPGPGLSMYRFSVGHGQLQCAACHNSTHAEFTSKTADNSTNDNLRAIETQGYSAALRECTACHATAPTSAKGGPHGMHYLGSAWVKDHHDVVSSSNKADCLYCHGATSAGSDLAVIKVAKTFNIGDGRTKSFAAEDRVTCWSCHNGPMR